jgi:hypothetical protein
MRGIHAFAQVAPVADCENRPSLFLLTLEVQSAASASDANVPFPFRAVQDFLSAGRQGDDISVPLPAVTLGKVGDGSLHSTRFSPAPETVARSLCQAVDAIATSATRLGTIESVLLSLLHMEPRPLLKLFGGTASDASPLSLTSPYLSIVPSPPTQVAPMAASSERRMHAARLTLT